MTPPVYARAVPGGFDLAIKVVPGASRERVLGLLGDRLKLAVRAPPEGGRANQAVLAVLAEWLGVGVGDLELVAGASQARKTVRLRSACDWPLPS